MEWYDRLNKTQGVQEIFQAAGVADAIAASITVIPKDVSLLEWIIRFFEENKNFFISLGSMFLGHWKMQLSSGGNRG